MDSLKTLKNFGFLLLLIVPSCSGMFEVIMTQFDPLLKSGKIMDLDKLKIARYNRTTFVLSGSFDLHNVDSLDGILASCLMFKKGGNEYRLLPYKLGPGNLCSMLMEEKYFYASFHACTENFPPVDSCDFKTGTYYVKNWLPDLSAVPPVFRNGDYMIECKLTKDDELINGYKIYGQLFNYIDAPHVVGKQ